MQHVDDGLSLEDQLPVSFARVDEYPNDFSLALLNESNESFLRAEMGLHESGDLLYDEHDELRQELRRQDQKLRLLMSMVGELLRQQRPLPPALPLRLSAGGLHCRLPLAAARGDRLSLEVYLDPQVPKPLSLFAEVLEISPEGDATLGFHAMGQGVRDGLEKVIFRHHRRLVALGRERQLGR